MKTIILFFLFCVSTLAQVPQGISHRGTAYNGSGGILSATTITVRIKILNGSSTGSVAYEEIHNSIQTNNNGQYSLNIGTVTNPTPTVAFNTIDWSNGQKWLEIGIAQGANQTANFVVGSSQLMSVPYAFHSNTTSSQKVFNNINELRSVQGVEGEMVYVKCHTTNGDGGEGYFIWKFNPHGNPGTADDNGIIIRTSQQINYSWVRIINDVINVRFFGINNDGNDGLKIQKAIDFAWKNSENPEILTNLRFRQISNAGSKVYIPAGNYNIKNTITIKSGVKIQGDNIENTFLIADNSTTTNGSMFILDSGPFGQVKEVTISDLTLKGGVSNANPDTGFGGITKDCFNLEASSTTTSGGLWGANFKNIKIIEFNGNGIVLRGSGFNDQTYSLPNQGLLFENVYIQRQQHTSKCLWIVGCGGQFTFINCGFDGLFYENRTKTTKYYNTLIETNAVQAPVVKFLTCTFQNSEYGALIKYGETVNFDNCWFEDLDVSVSVEKSNNNPGIPSRSINIANCRFANASGFGTLNITNKNASGGTCISVEGGSNVNVQNNYVLTSDPNYNNNTNNNFFIRNNGLDSKINALNNSFQNPSIGRTSGIANRIVSITGNSLNTYGHKFINVNCVPTTNTTNNIKEIISEIAAGESITIQANGTTGNIKFDNTKNIVFAKSTTTSLSLLPKETATFIKIDKGIGPINGVYYNETYQLISVNKTY